jgi:hypothetical protein
MRAIHVGVDQGNGDGLHTRLREVRDRGPDFRLVDGPHFLALRVHAAFCFDRILQGGQGFGFRPYDPARQAARHEAAGNLHDLPVAFGNDQTNPGTFAFQHGIRGNCGAVQEDIDLRRRQAGFGTDFVQADENPFRAVGWGGRGFVAPERAATPIEQEQIGESPPHIHAKAVAHHATPELPQLCGVPPDRSNEPSA